MAKEKEKTSTASEQLAELLKANTKIQLDDLFSKPQLMQKDVFGVPFTILGATIAKGIGGEYVAFAIDLPAGAVENVEGEAEVSAPVTANNLKLVAYCAQNPKGSVTGATFGKQGREYYIAKYKAPAPEEKKKG